MNQTTKISPQHQEELLYGESGRALAQAAQRGHGVSLSGVIPKPPGYVSVSPALCDPSLAGDGQDDPHRFLPTLTTL